jgi:hypothetical protein
VSTGPWHIPYENWDASISSSTVDAVGPLRAELTPGSSKVIKLLWDTFDLSPDVSPERARVTVRVVGAGGPDAVCLVAAWDRTRPFTTDDWSATPGNGALEALSLAPLVAAVGGVYVIELDNASGLTRCTTGVILGIEPMGEITGTNYLEIQSFSSGVSAQLSLYIPVTDEDDDEDDYNYGGQNPDGTDGEENQEGPKHTAAKLNRELALRTERLGAGRLRPEIEYSTRLRAEGSVRVLQ